MPLLQSAGKLGAVRLSLRQITALPAPSCQTPKTYFKNNKRFLEMERAS